MTKINFIKVEKYIFTLWLTNPDLEFRVGGGLLGIGFQIFSKKILKITK